MARRSNAIFTRCKFQIFACFAFLVSIYFLMFGSMSMKDPSFVWSHNTSRDLRDYVKPDKDTTVLSNRSLCGSGRDHPYLLVVVCSSVSKRKARDVIRETWGSDFRQGRYKGYSIRLAFLLGAASNLYEQEAVVEESNLHGDIIQEDIIDSYYNLTIKSTMMLKWVNNYCKNVNYLFKVDDDNFLNLNNVMKLLTMFGRRKMIMGNLNCYSFPVRNSGSKWYCPDWMYSELLFPPYISGPAYIISGDVIETLYGTALNTPLIHLEDVFLTGIVAKKANLQPTGVDMISYYRTDTSACVIDKYATVHDFEEEEIRELWEQREKAIELCSGVDFKTVRLSGCRWRFG